MAYVKPNVYIGFGPATKQVWNALASRERKEDSASLCVNQTKLAKKLGYCRKTIQNALKTFISANLLEKVKHGEGRGNHNSYRFLWDFIKLRPKKERTKERTTKIITKGSPKHRYWMWKLRTWVESTHLGSKSSQICGEIFQKIKGEREGKWVLMMRSLKDNMLTDWNMSGFYSWLHSFAVEVLNHSNGDSPDTSTPSGSASTALSEDNQEVEETEELIGEIREQKEETKEGFEQDPPPRSKDYGSFDEYLKAMDEWEEERKDDG